MSTMHPPLQARLHLGDKTLILATHQDLDALQIKLIISLEDSPAWTRGDIINQAKQVIFEARKSGY